MAATIDHTYPIKIMLFPLFIIFAAALARASASNLVINIFYPESQLNMTNVNRYGEAFLLNVYSCMENHIRNGSFTFGGASCPGGEWFTGDANAKKYVVSPKDIAGANRNDAVQLMLPRCVVKYFFRRFPNGNSDGQRLHWTGIRNQLYCLQRRIHERACVCACGLPLLFPYRPALRGEYRRHDR